MANSVGSDKNAQVDVIDLTDVKVGEISLALIDLHGVEALSLEAVASASGFSVPEIEAFALDQGELIDLACDQIYAEIDLVPTQKAWPDRFRHYSRSFRTALLRHPKALFPMATRPLQHESSMRVAEHALAELTAVGYDTQSANRVLIVIVSFVLGHALTEAGPGQQADQGMAPIDDVRLDGFRRNLPSESLPISSQVMAEANDRDAEFELGLKLIVDGLERQLLHA